MMLFGVLFYANIHEISTTVKFTHQYFPWLFVFCVVHVDRLLLGGCCPGYYRIHYVDHGGPQLRDISLFLPTEF